MRRKLGRWANEIFSLSECHACRLIPMPRSTFPYRSTKDPQEALVAAALDLVVAERGAPQSITVDNGTEFASRAMDAWAYGHGIQLDFIRPGKPVEKGYIESFNGRLRDGCLNVQVFFSLADARQKLGEWRHDYNHVRPHSALADRAPVEVAGSWRATSKALPMGGLWSSQNPTLCWRQSVEIL